MPRQQGFSLLEAIVALVLLATVGMSLFTWLSTQLDGLYRLEAHHQRQHAKQNALEFIQAINPMLTSSGTEQIGMYRFDWQAEAMEPEKDGVYLKSGGVGLYQVGIYTTQVEIFTEEQKEALSSFQVRLFGYKQVRQPEFLN